jgi:hypothetical protein
MTRRKQSSALAQRLGTFFKAQTVADVVTPATSRPRQPQFEKRQLAGQLLATLSPAVLAETGYSERRGGDRSDADPRSLRAARLRHGAARARTALLAIGPVVASWLLTSAAAHPFA